MEYLHYTFQSETLCIGERIKKGTFRPTVMTIPYTTITGALKTYFGGDEIHAVGCIESYDAKDYLTYSPRDRGVGVSKIPISLEFLVNVRGHVYILKNTETERLPDKFELRMGALRVKGLGYTQFTKNGIIEVNENQLMYGELNTRIPIEHLDKFLVKTVKPVYGYLLKPVSLSKAVYVKSLFEGSEVYAPWFLIKGGVGYGYSR
ncbi:conserved hypothetical protein [Ferroglobus placidus DSM 10642]|uniref:Uncharacterized protein n=1 Tax=Ferroglobus placidus (strain DSM 10642 / AEDII12DO) TaxID=589924 RepID=D3S2E2_FERPA|nr:hypothetical protein [Ferroglobus placidus]ADC64472.1 conserved hypothetical protein [Ferroglobus placidus DSM 10642]